MNIFEIITLAVLLATVSSQNSHSALVHDSMPQMSSAGISPAVQGFVNRTGSLFGSAQLAGLINYLNSASSFYKSDEEQNLRYIQRSMTDAFGGSYNYYGVIIQINETYSYSDWVVYNAGGENYAALAPGVNRINPTWSYLVYLIEGYRNYVYMFEFSRGSGISIDKVRSINDAIYKYDGSAACTCQNTRSIAAALKKSDGQDWYVICQSYGKGVSSYSFVPVKN
jgi:hypothetical protein